VLINKTINNSSIPCYSIREEKIKSNEVAPHRIGKQK